MAYRPSTAALQLNDSNRDNWVSWFVKTIQDHSKGMHTLPRSSFCKDLLLILAGARPALMLDYAPGLKSTQMLSLLKAVNALPGTPPCGLLSLDGCLLIANLPALAKYLTHLLSLDKGTIRDTATADDSPNARQIGYKAQQVLPALIAFSTGAGGNNKQTAIIMDEHQTQAVFQGFTPLLEHVNRWLIDYQVEQSQQQMPSPFYVDLASIKSLPLMPTLFGILLGYPLVYYVQGGQDAARKVSHYLSCTDLLRFSLETTPCQNILAQVPQDSRPDTVGRSKNKAKLQTCAVMNDGHTIAAFTVPSFLCNTHDSHDSHSGCNFDHVSCPASSLHHTKIQQWCQDATAAVSVSGVGFSTPTLHCAPVDACAVSL